MKKVWNVEIGNNWTSKKVIARNFKEAASKAMKCESPIPRESRWISKVELICECN